MGGYANLNKRFSNWGEAVADLRVELVTQFGALEPTTTEINSWPAGIPNNGDLYETVITMTKYQCSKLAQMSDVDDAWKVFVERYGVEPVSMREFESALSFQGGLYGSPRVKCFAICRVDQELLDYFRDNWNDLIKQKVEGLVASAIAAYNQAYQVK